MSADRPWRTERYEALGTDRASSRNGTRGRRREAVRRIGEPRTCVRSEIWIDEDELGSQLFHHDG